MKKVYLIPVFIISVLMFILSSCGENKDTASSPSPDATATPSFASLSGNVAKDTNWSGTFDPYEGADVLLYENATINEVKGASTNAQGDYSMTEIDPGTYDLVVQVFEYMYSGEASVNGGAFESIPTHCDGFGAYGRMTKTALTLDAGDSMTVDFRFCGY